MNLVIDIGNTQYKICIFRENEIVFHEYIHDFDAKYLSQLISSNKIEKAIYSDTRGINKEAFEEMISKYMPIIELKHTTELPIIINYATPETLGKDRIAGAAGAYALFSNQNSLVIDIGTALTIDFINNKNEFCGGIISPGPELRFKALHQFTGKLPLEEPVADTEDIGYSTKTAIQFGVQNGIVHEINGYISRFNEQYEQLNIILTGGYAFLFDKKINYPIFADSFLVPRGLNRILVYNELQK